MDVDVYASLTDADLVRLRDDLINAHAQGASRVRFGDRDVELRSRTEVEGMIRAMNLELARRVAPEQTRRYRGFNLVSGGGYR